MANYKLKNDTTMCKLTKTFEKFRNNELQVIELTCDVKSMADVDDLSYDDFKANLFINHQFVADISHVLDDAGVFTDMVDSTDWHKLYAESLNAAA